MASCPANLKNSTSSDQLDDLSDECELSPIFIRNDRQSTSYLNKLQENEGLLHLCVTIKRGTYTFLLTESRKVAHGKLNVSGWRWQK
uniref:Uncharacterized protein n=1 Tax=Brassica oleracea var. oleracea TaxID=109376 RepID=A0A0D3AT57_BRAOL